MAERRTEWPHSVYAAAFVVHCTLVFDQCLRTCKNVALFTIRPLQLLLRSLYQCLYRYVVSAFARIVIRVWILWRDL